VLQNRFRPAILGMGCLNERGCSCTRTLKTKPVFEFLDVISLIDIVMYFNTNNEKGEPSKMMVAYQTIHKFNL